MEEKVKERHFGPVWFLPGQNHGKYPNCHSVYIEGAKVLIDPASDRERLIQLRENPGVEAVWLTHWHEDHFMHLDLFEDLPLSISEKDAPPLSDLEIFMDAYGMDDEDEREHWRFILRETFHFRPRTPEHFLKGGNIVHLETGTVEIIDTPGHTPGHLSFFFQEPEILLLGDYDLTKFGPWYGDHESDIHETIKSVERLREVPARTWIASHENGIFEEAPGDKWDQYLAVIIERERKLIDLLSTSRTMDEIVGAWIIYGRPREPKAFFEFGERSHMKKHLEKLIREGRVVRDGAHYVASH
ncbi:MAG: MBL fold metallo-hydrolase [Proteobacteria bacterium]|nr:MBL fold metallo-hydrolase [Pseudomonadota bacterium]